MPAGRISFVFFCETECQRLLFFEMKRTAAEAITAMTATERLSAVEGEPLSPEAAGSAGAGMVIVVDTATASGPSSAM